jgi:hypothetical protein
VLHSKRNAAFVSSSSGRGHGCEQVVRYRNVSIPANTGSLASNLSTSIEEGQKSLREKLILSSGNNFTCCGKALFCIRARLQPCRKDTTIPGFIENCINNVLSPLFKEAENQSSSQIWYDPSFAVLDKEPAMAVHLRTATKQSRRDGTTYSPARQCRVGSGL